MRSSLQFLRIVETAALALYLSSDFVNSHHFLVVFFPSLPKGGDRKARNNLAGTLNGSDSETRLSWLVYAHMHFGALISLVTSRRAVSWNWRYSVATGQLIFFLCGTLAHAPNFFLTVQFELCNVAYYSQASLECTFSFSVPSRLIRVVARRTMITAVKPKT